MIFQIKIYKPNGKLKKTIKAKDAEKLYWKDVIGGDVAHDRSGIKEKQTFNKYCKACGKRFKAKSNKAMYCKLIDCQRIARRSWRDIRKADGRK